MQEEVLTSKYMYKLMSKAHASTIAIYNSNKSLLSNIQQTHDILKNSDTYRSITSGDMKDGAITKKVSERRYLVGQIIDISAVSNKTFQNPILL